MTQHENYIGKQCTFDVRGMQAEAKVIGQTNNTVLVSYEGHPLELPISSITIKK